MIVCLPCSPGKAWVRRIDWMISLALRSNVRCGSWTRSWGSSRWRTSCWVIVDAPRARPVIESSAAEKMPSGSNPALVQNVWSSTAVVASMRVGEIWLNATTSRLTVPNVASWILPVRS